MELLEGISNFVEESLHRLAAVPLPMKIDFHVQVFQYLAQIDKTCYNEGNTN